MYRVDLNSDLEKALEIITIGMDEEIFKVRLLRKRGMWLARR